MLYVTRASICVELRPFYCSKRILPLDLDALILLVFLLLKKVLSASSYGHFTTAKEFRSQCRILCVKMAPRRRPKGVQGVQNEPKCVPEGSRRRPRPSKKRPGGKKLDLVVFYRLFKRPQVTGRHQAGSRNNLLVREVNRTIIFTNTNLLCTITITGTPPNTHWCARGHGADLKAKASCRRPHKYKKCKNIKNVKK